MFIYFFLLYERLLVKCKDLYVLFYLTLYCHCMDHCLVLVWLPLLACHIEEWNANSRTELINHPHPPTCLFADISQFFLPPVQAMLETLRSNDQFKTRLWPLVASRKAVQTNPV